MHSLGREFCKSQYRLNPGTSGAQIFPPGTLFFPCSDDAVTVSQSQASSHFPFPKPSGGHQATAPAPGCTHPQVQAACPRCSGLNPGNSCHCSGPTLDLPVAHPSRTPTQLVTQPCPQASWGSRAALLPAQHLGAQTISSHLCTPALGTGPGTW